MKIKTYLTTALLLAGTVLPLLGNTQPGQPTLTPQVSDAQARQKLMMAYRREFIFLDQEVRALKKRQLELDSLYTEKKSKAKVNLDILDEKLLSLRAKIDDRVKLLTQKEEFIEEVQDNADQVDVALTQMLVSLERYGIGEDINQEKLEKGDAKLAAIDKLFSEAFSSLSTINDTKVKEDAEFYDIEGKLLKGKVVTLGQNAAYGISGDKGGVLAPAGGGKLAVWNGEGLSAAKSFASNGSPAGSYPIYLYEDINKKAERVVEKDFGDIMEGGGIIGWVIVTLGSIAMLMVLVRVLLLMSASTNSKALVEKVGSLLKSDKKDEALAYLEKHKSAAGRVLKSTVQHLHYKPDQLEDVIAESVLHETPTLEKFETAIIVVAAVAPLMGLLGTVTGMISTFDIITIHGTGDPKMLSGGISEALITTMLGLTVAIPLLLLGNLLSGWSEKIMSNIEHSALSITNISRS